jgi:uncharacterized glyoxalase superfamily protein PhnB
MPDGIPDGWHSVTPRLVADDPVRLVAFLSAAFDARGAYDAERPALMRIGDSIVMVSGSGPRTATRAFLHLYVEDADATYRRALEAGAVSVEEPQETPWGDRRAMITDPCGNDWQIATYGGRL